MQHKIQIELDKLSNNFNNLSKSEINKIIEDFLLLLESGEIRSAEKDLSSGDWKVNNWVKEGILLLFKLGKLEKISGFGFDFFDKSTIPLRQLNLENNIRLVPGGSSIRRGAYIAKGVICMPPMYINIGAYVDEDTMIDSHALVGTCAQIGKRVHISAATQIGGVLEPIGASPVIIEDDVMVGGNCGIYEGVTVKKNAILGSGLILNSSTKVYDIINETILPFPVVIPENAVVVQGARAINTPFASENKLSISTPIIIKYRDKKSNAKTELESILR